MASKEESEASKKARDNGAKRRRKTWILILVLSTVGCVYIYIHIYLSGDEANMDSVWVLQFFCLPDCRLGKHQTSNH